MTYFLKLITKDGDEIRHFSDRRTAEEEMSLLLFQPHVRVELFEAKCLGAGWYSSERQQVMVTL